MSVDLGRAAGVTPAGLHDLIRQQAGRNSAAPVIFSPRHTPLTYRRLWLLVNEVAEVLNSLGIGRNDRVAAVLPEGPEAAVASLAIACAATYAPINPAYGAGEFDRYFADLNPRALLVASGSSSAARHVAETRNIPILELFAPPEAYAGAFTIRGKRTDGPVQRGPAQPNDVALVLYTSGTTGQQKLVSLTHKNICCSANNICGVVKLVETDRCLSVMPLFHIHGLSAVFASLVAGSGIVCTQNFSPSLFLEYLEEFHPTWYTAAPTIHRAILETANLHPEVSRSSLRFIRSASSPMPQKLISDLERVFDVPVIEAYGMTEAGPQIASNRLPPFQRREGSVGRSAGPEVAIADEAGQ
ncbi:MAG TPA: AMP-binding protein, partial [Terriglobia bacterium]|nr:AMP-binding protein [Terriglobia bacterium]